MNKDDLLQYGFYAENGKYTVVLNKEKIKEFLGADEILLEEKEHK